VASFTGFILLSVSQQSWEGAGIVKPLLEMRKQQLKVSIRACPLRN
jgi:hypothetical protein